MCLYQSFIVEPNGNVTKFWMWLRITDSDGYREVMRLGYENLKPLPIGVKVVLLFMVGGRKGKGGAEEGVIKTQL